MAHIQKPVFLSSEIHSEAYQHGLFKDGHSAVLTPQHYSRLGLASDHHLRNFCRYDPVLCDAVILNVPRQWYSCANRCSRNHETGKWIADDDNNCSEGSETLVASLRRLGVFFLRSY